MKKSYVWFILFWATVIGIKVWAGYHGQTTLADSISEIAGFACLLVGTILCATFGMIHKRRFSDRSAERLFGEIAVNNYLAILFQGFLLLALGVIAIFFKWWIAAILGAPLLLGVLILFFRGWPSFRLNRDAVSESVQRTRSEFLP